MKEYERLIEDYEEILKMRERELNIVNESNSSLMEMVEDLEQRNSNWPNKLSAAKDSFAARNNSFYWRIRSGLRFIWRMLKKLKRTEN